MPLLTTGSPIPDFALASDRGAQVDARSLLGAWAVLFFYPKADTPGCTREAQAFSALRADFELLGVRVFGVSRDHMHALCMFRGKYALDVELLSDPELVVHRAFGAFGEKIQYGKKREGVLRSTFVVAPTGVVAHAFPNVKVDGHAARVLDVVRTLQLGATPTGPKARRGRQAS